MYVITRKAEYGNFNLFYQFSYDQTDLYCVVTDNLQTCKKYTEEEKKKLENNELLKVRNVKFRKVFFTFDFKEGEVKNDS